MARILITSFGSLGDLHPYLALGMGLRERGHAAVIATSPIHGPRVAAAGLPFVPLATALDRYLTPQAAAGFIERIFDPRQGPQRLVREMMQDFAQTCAATREAVAGCDLAISHPLTYATPIVCRELGKRWLSSALAPMSFMSAFDPPYLSAAPFLETLHAWSPALFRTAFRLAKGWSRTLVRPVYEECRQRGIAPPPASPLFDGQFSPHGTLALFPDAFAARQPDWPVRTTMTGFARYTQGGTEAETQARLDAFLAAGESPLVFALGSSAVEIAQDFFPVAAQIARRLRRRAVLVAGSGREALDHLASDPALLVLDYIAYEDLFPHACLIIHQGGIGTLAQAARAGRPSLIVPFGFDQYDNARRMVRLGAAQQVARTDFTVAHVAPLIAGMLEDPSLARTAAAVGARLAQPDGVANACDVIEACIAGRAVDADCVAAVAKVR